MPAALAPSSAIENAELQPHWVRQIITNTKLMMARRETIPEGEAGLDKRVQSCSDAPVLEKECMVN